MSKFPEKEILEKKLCLYFIHEDSSIRSCKVCVNGCSRFVSFDLPIRPKEIHIKNNICYPYISSVGTFYKSLPSTLLTNASKWVPRSVLGHIPITPAVTKIVPDSLVSLAKWLSVRLRTKWLWVRVQLQSFKIVPSGILKIFLVFLGKSLGFLKFTRVH